MYVILGLLHAIIIQRPYDQKKGGGAEETKKEREGGGKVVTRDLQRGERE